MLIFLSPLPKLILNPRDPLKKGVTNFFDNLEEVDTTVNQITYKESQLAMRSMTFLGLS